MASMHQLQGATNVVITGGNFNQVQHEGRDQGLHILRQHIAADAMYDSAERFPPAKCHPGTRESIIKTIMEWINDPAPSEQALWLYGPAGAGKSAIAHSIAMLLQEIVTESKYAASFFFARGAIGRGDGTHLFSTIAYQLAFRFPLLRGLIDAAMLDNPTLPTKSIDVQLRYLIIEPLKRVSDWPAHTPTVIIDGLDECSGSKRMQSEILSLISKAIIEHQIPLRFFIVSRPEYWIADSFEVGPLVAVTKSRSLRDDRDADKDIHNYLREGFDKIRGENRRTMASVPRPWPPDYIVERFVESASGQFIYASTVLKFVGSSSDFCDPQEQLRILTTPGPHYVSPFSELDRLYSTILSAYPRLDSLKRVLGGILVGAHEKVIQELLGVGAAETQLVLSSLSSLIVISRPPRHEIFDELEETFGSPLFDSSISFSHLSFAEFLQDESRSEKYAINWRVMNIRMVRAVMKLGNDLLLDSPGIGDTVSRMGLSSFRNMLLRKFPAWHQIHSEALDTLMNLNEILESVLSATPSSVPHANHVFWFTTALSILLPGLAQSLRNNDKKKYIHHQTLFKSLQDRLNAVRSFSATELLRQTLMTTPTFSFLATHSRSTDIIQYFNIDYFSLSMHVNDRVVISDLHHLHHWIYFPLSEQISVPHVGTFGDIHWNEAIAIIGDVFWDELYKLTGDNQECQQVATWDNQRLSYVASVFTSLQKRDFYTKYFMDGVPNADLYLRYSRLADINSEEYFKDEKKMLIFHLVMDLSFWDRVYNPVPILHYHELVWGALLWLARQMTAERKALVAKHDDTLPQKMERVAKELLKNHFFRHFTGVQRNATFQMVNDITGFDNEYIHSATLHIVPPVHDGACSTVQCSVGRRRYPNTVSPEKRYALPKNMNNIQEAIRNFSFIFQSDWSPYLAASLLTMLVKNHYGILDDRFEQRWSRVSMTCFIPLLRCLPYADPSRENLDAFRALHYLYFKIDLHRRWRPPFGFCSLAIEFLKKYDSALLSSLEFNTLESWLSVMSAHESKKIIACSMRRDIILPTTCEEDDYTSDEDDSEDDSSSLPPPSKRARLQ